MSFEFLKRELWLCVDRSEEEGEDMRSLDTRGVYSLMLIRRYCNAGEK